MRQTAPHVYSVVMLLHCILFAAQTDPRVGGAGPLLKASEVGNPMTGDFTVADDVSAIAPIIVSSYEHDVTYAPSLDLYALVRHVEITNSSIN